MCVCCGDGCDDMRDAKPSRRPPWPLCVVCKRSAIGCNYNTHTSVASVTPTPLPYSSLQSCPSQSCVCARRSSSSRHVTPSSRRGNIRLCVCGLVCVWTWMCVCKTCMYVAIPASRIIAFATLCSGWFLFPTRFLIC